MPHRREQKILDVYILVRYCLVNSIREGTRLLTEIIKKIGISRRHLNYLLAGERNASPQLARKIERVTRIPKEVFVFGSARERVAAWKKVCGGEQCTARQRPASHGKALHGKQRQGF